MFLKKTVKLIEYAALDFPVPFFSWQVLVSGPKHKCPSQTGFSYLNQQHFWIKSKQCSSPNSGAQPLQSLVADVDQYSAPLAGKASEHFHCTYSHEMPLRWHVEKRRLVGVFFPSTHHPSEQTYFHQFQFRKQSDLYRITMDYIELKMYTCQRTTFELLHEDRNCMSCNYSWHFAVFFRFYAQSSSAGQYDSAYDQSQPFRTRTRLKHCVRAPTSLRLGSQRGVHMARWKK